MRSNKGMRSPLCRNFTPRNESLRPRGVTLRRNGYGARDGKELPYYLRAQLVGCAKIVVMPVPSSGGAILRGAARSIGQLAALFADKSNPTTDLTLAL